MTKLSDEISKALGTRVFHTKLPNGKLLMNATGQDLQNVSKVLLKIMDIKSSDLSIGEERAQIEKLLGSKLHQWASHIAESMEIQQLFKRAQNDPTLSVDEILLQTPESSSMKNLCPALADANCP